MAQPNRKTSSSSLLHLQLVFALASGVLSVPLDSLRIWMAGNLDPDLVPYIALHLIRAVIFSSITFCTWRWILPKLHGLLILRLFIQLMLGLVLFGSGMLLAWNLVQELGLMPATAPQHIGMSAEAAYWIIVIEATFYMLLGGLALESASAEQSKLSEAALGAQLELLRNQINHHFLFNSLNLIAELTGIDADRAERLVIRLAEVLRYSLGASRRRLAPLRDELEAVESYLELEGARSGDKIRVQTRIAPEVDAEDLQIPPLLIQPLVENAVRHGLQNGNCPGTITITAHRDDEHLTISVQDDGVGIDPDRILKGHVEGVALSNLRERLRAFYGDRAQFHLTSALGGGALAEVLVPVRRVIDQQPQRHGIAWRLFFYHFGSPLAVTLFFALRTFTHLATAKAMLAGWLIEIVYLVAASAAAELKLLDLAFAAFFVTSVIANWVGMSNSFFAFGPAWMYLYCAAIATVPQVFGNEPFTCYWARRVTPDWIQDSPSFLPICRDLALMWGGTFLLSAAVAAGWQGNTIASAIVPIALLVGIAMPMSYRYPRIYIKRIGSRGTSTAANFIRGLPLRFDATRAEGLDLAVQFVVSGNAPGNYFVQLSGGKCDGGEGTLSNPNLTIYAAAETWARIGDHDLTPEGALRKGRLRVRGDEKDLLRFLDCFLIPGTDDRRAAA
jgi:sensor histidine kinase YesM